MPNFQFVKPSFAFGETADFQIEYLKAAPWVLIFAQARLRAGEKIASFHFSPRHFSGAVKNAVGVAAGKVVFDNFGRKATEFGELKIRQTHPEGKLAPPLP